MAEKVKKLDGDFLLDSGLLFWINKAILHPYGLAIEVECEEDVEAATKEIEDAVFVMEDLMNLKAKTEEEMAKYSKIGKLLIELLNIKEREVRLGRIWDYRDDPEGILYSEDELNNGYAKFYKFVEEFGVEKLIERAKTTGFVQQMDDEWEDKLRVFSKRLVTECPDAVTNMYR